MQDHLRTELVVEALKMALGRGRKLGGDLWLHSDRGVQFSSEQFREVINLVSIEPHVPPPPGTLSAANNCLSITYVDLSVFFQCPHLSVLSARSLAAECPSSRARLFYRRERNDS